MCINSVLGKTSLVIKVAAVGIVENEFLRPGTGALRKTYTIARQWLLQLSLNWPSLSPVKKRPIRTYYILEGQCAGPKVCPLSRVQAGTTVCIKKLSTAPELRDRLRELGLCEDQQVKVVACESTFICQVCNARFGISEKLADSILVEAIATPEETL
jgi:Fe2+ transport system protein FeoA